MRSFLPVLCASVVLFASGCAAHRVQAAHAGSAPVVLSDSVREQLPNDYLRVSFVPAGVPVTTLSKPGAIRAFATATPLFVPPLKLSALPAYSGLVNDDKNVLYAMRCKPQRAETVDAVLATWSNVFAAIQRDVPLAAGACDASGGEIATQVACFAKGYTDAPATAVPTSLAHTFSYAGTLYDANHKELATWLQSNYGIFPAFSGMGYSVKDSYYLDRQPMTSEQILEKSISSEYVLKNVSLADAGCRCISVAPYDGRAEDRLDPEFIQQAGGDGSCKPVDRLKVVSR